jgi:hypothetical protein
MVDNSMLVEFFVRCKNLKVVHINSWKSHIKAHKLEEDLLPYRQEFINYTYLLDFIKEFNTIRTSQKIGFSCYLRVSLSSTKLIKARID